MLVFLCGVLIIKTLDEFDTDNFEPSVYWLYTKQVTLRLCSLIFLLFIPHLQLAAASPYHVILDPGHGGKDDGATKFKVKESEITLIVAKKLEQLLKKDKEFSVSLTRRSNRSLSLKQRTQIAEARKGDLFLSIHVNSSLDPRAHGGEIYFQNQLPPDEESLFLASKENAAESSESTDLSWPLTPLTLPSETPKDVQLILMDLQRNERIRLSGLMSESLIKFWTGKIAYRKRKIRQAPFYVISNINMTSVLVELGFVTNSMEAKKLVSDPYQDKLAKELYLGLKNVKEVLDKERITP